MRKRAALLLAVVLSALMIDPPASALSDGWYSVPHSPQLYVHAHYGSGPGYTFYGDGTAWRNAGYPTPRPAPTAYVKYTWSSSIYGVTFWDDGWEWTRLSGQQWARAGYPSPYTAGWILGTDIYQFPTSPELFAEIDGTVHKLTGAEWAAMEYRQPRMESDGFMKLSWDSNIAMMVTPTLGYPIDYSEWAAEGFPTPEVRAMLPGDSVCQFPGSPDLLYEGSSFYGELTYAQWAAAGFPQPVPC